jgi:hypothetical protein
MTLEFTQPRPNLYQSNAGFSIEVLGRTGMNYIEGDRTMRIDSEVLAKPGAMAIWSRSIRHWEPPHDTQPVTDEDRRRVVENIRLAFESQGYELQVSDAWDSMKS